MARRRSKGGFSRLAIGTLIIIILSVGLIIALPSLSNIGLFGGGGQFTAQTGNNDFWSIPSSFYFALGDFDGVHCWIALTLTQGNTDGTTETLASNSGVTVELLDITGGFTTSAKEVRFVKVTPRLSCQDTTSTSHDIRLAGGTIRLESFVKDKITGVENKVDSRLVVIPNLNRNLKVETGGGNIVLPTLTSQASTIESFINVPDTVASRNIDVTFKTSSWANIRIDGTTFKAGDLQAGLGGLLKFINPDFGASAPPTTKGTQVTMTSVNPIQHHYIGNSGVVPSGVTSSSQVVTLNDEIRATFTGTEDNWSPAEGIPTITIKDPRGITRASGIPMTTISILSGGLTQFSRIGVSVPFQINDNNIDQLEGTWRAEMHQAGRTAIGVKSFILLDSRPVVVEPTPPIVPTCDPVTEQLVNGKCEPISPEPMGGQCPPATEIGETVSGMTIDELNDTFNQLDSKVRDSCEETTFILVNAELNKRDVDPTSECPQGQTRNSDGICVSTPPTTPEVCPEGTEGTFPDCVIIEDCQLPNTLVNGICTPPTGTGCPQGQIRDDRTNVCRDPEMCFQDPVCGADEKFSVTEELDDCGANKLICVPRTITPLACPQGQQRDSLGICVTITIVGCPQGQNRNSLGICEIPPTPPPPTNGDRCEEGEEFNEETLMCEENFCAFDPFPNLAQCFSQIFAGAGSLTAGGEPDEELTGLLTIVVLVIILVIIVAVVIRVRRGKGFGT